MDLIINADLFLQRLHAQHVPALFALTQANRVYLRRWLPWLDRVQEPSDTAYFIHSVSELYREKRCVQFALFYQQQLVGVVGFNHLDTVNRQATIGYWLTQTLSGRGIMTQSVAHLLNWGFTDCGLHRIEIRCALGNTKSRAIPERLGFRHEGTLKQCEWLYDHYVDHALYALLAGEYLSQSERTSEFRADII